MLITLSYEMNEFELIKETWTDKTSKNFWAYTLLTEIDIGYCCLWFKSVDRDIVYESKFMTWMTGNTIGTCYKATCTC